jgi:hypothetical protein
MKMTDTFLYILLILFAFAVIVSLWRFQKNPNNEFDILDLLMENGRVSRTAAAFSVTLIITSWIMLKLTVDKSMTEGYLGIYGGLWVTPIVTRMFATSTPSPKEP